MRLRLYYLSKYEKPCAVCDKPTGERSRFFGKRVGIPVCSLACRSAYNPFNPFPKYISDVDGILRMIPPVEPIWWFTHF